MRVARHERRPSHRPGHAQPPGCRGCAPAVATGVHARRPAGRPRVRRRRRDHRRGRLVRGGPGRCPVRPRQLDARTPGAPWRRRCRLRHRRRPRRDPRMVVVAKPAGGPLAGRTRLRPVLARLRGRRAEIPAVRQHELPRTGGAAVVVRALRKRFGAKEAVAGIDLEVAAGSLAGLVGPNGAGKTTSLSMMTGLLRPDSGQILINGIDVWKDPPAAKAAMGVVPAEARLFDRLSGEELLEYAGRLRGLPAGEARARAAQLLDVLDLTADAKRLVADYSTGMRKKATLGCALIHNPPVLFLDEPLEGVDPVSGDVIRRLLTRFVGSGSTVLFSSHVMELVEQVCDHVSIIDKGKIMVTGTIDEVRGGKTLQRAFIDLVGPRATDEEVLSWLGSSSS